MSSSPTLNILFQTCSESLFFLIYSNCFENWNRARKLKPECWKHLYLPLNPSAQRQALKMTCPTWGIGWDSNLSSLCAQNGCPVTFDGGILCTFSPLPNTVWRSLLDTLLTVHKNFTAIYYLPCERNQATPLSHSSDHCDNLVYNVVIYVALQRTGGLQLFASWVLGLTRYTATPS